MKSLKTIAIAVPLATLVAWGLLALAQLWGGVVSDDTFAKLTGSSVIVIGISVIVSLAIRGHIENEKLKKEGYLDD
jgi:tetrahydromethanopterin S-methyltransferase subunit E